MTTAVSSLCRKNPHAPCEEQMPYWVEFQLVDEQGDPVANMPWTVESSHPVSGPVDNFTHTGQSDSDGLIRIDMPHGLELRLKLDANLLTREMEKRSLRVIRLTIPAAMFLCHCWPNTSMLIQGVSLSSCRAVSKACYTERATTGYRTASTRRA